MEPETIEALRELREWCKKHQMVFDTNQEFHPRMIRLKGPNEYVIFGEFSADRSSVIVQSRESF